MARSTRRFVAALALAAATAVGIGACSPITTIGTYAASDGTRGDLGETITVEDLLVLTTKEGAPGNVLGAISNSGGDAADVTLTAEGVNGDLSYTVEPGETLLLGPEHETAELSSVPVAPGATLSVQISAPSEGSIQLNAPVLNGDIPPYSEYLPEESSTSEASTP